MRSLDYKAVVWCRLHLPDSVDIEEVKGESRKKKLVYARHLYYYFSRKYIDISHEEISNLLKQDHATSLYAIKKIDNYLEFDKSVRLDVEKLDKILEKGVYQVEIEKINLLELRKFNTLHKTYLN